MRFFVQRHFHFQAFSLSQPLSVVTFLCISIPLSCLHSTHRPYNAIFHPSYSLVFFPPHLPHTHLSLILHPWTFSFHPSSSPLLPHFHRISHSLPSQQMSFIMLNESLISFSLSLRPFLPNFPSALFSSSFLSFLFLFLFRCLAFRLPQVFSSSHGSDGILKSLEGDVITLKRQVQSNKQLISQHKQKVKTGRICKLIKIVFILLSLSTFFVFSSPVLYYHIEVKSI